MSGAKKHYSGVDLAAARKALALTQAPRLDVDWLAVDASRCLAVFLGDDAIQPPVDADVRGTTKLVETIRASFDQWLPYGSIARVIVHAPNGTSTVATSPGLRAPMGAVTVQGFQSRVTCIDTVVAAAARLPCSSR